MHGARATDFGAGADADVDVGVDATAAADIPTCGIEGIAAKKMGGLVWFVDMPLGKDIVRAFAFSERSWSNFPVEN